VADEAAAAAWVAGLEEGQRLAAAKAAAMHGPGRCRAEQASYEPRPMVFEDVECWEY
jgi:hypothetical protein